MEVGRAYEEGCGREWDRSQDYRERQEAKCRGRKVKNFKKEEVRLRKRNERRRSETGRGFGSGKESVLCCRGTL